VRYSKTATTTSGAAIVTTAARRNAHSSSGLSRRSQTIARRYHSGTHSPCAHSEPLGSHTGTIQANGCHHRSVRVEPEPHTACRAIATHATIANAQSGISKRRKRDRSVREAPPRSIERAVSDAAVKNISGMAAT
jgi:hypothetical protein